MSEKPHKGSLKNWAKWPTPDLGLGYMIVGEFVGHPRFDGMDGHTSYVVKHEGAEIETRNSRYTLIGDSV